MTLTKPKQYAVFTALALLMAATRYAHFLAVPDASWAVFFIGGFYLKGASRWAFPALMIEAAVIDYIATQHLGVSSYCLSPAYAFLIPTHGVLWLGGLFLQSRQRFDLRGLAVFAATLFVSASWAFGISNGSFYWLSGRVAAPTWTGYTVNFSQYYLYFIAVPSAYVSIVAVLHTLLASVRSAAVTDRQKS